MPTVFRTMKRADDGLPLVGSNAKELSVRVPPNPNSDIDLDTSEQVILNGRGLSVAENWRHLLSHLIPKRLKTLFPGAAGPDTLTCYRMGTGGFATGAVSDDLDLVLKSRNPRAGNLVPSRMMHRDQFQAALAATRNEWTIDET